MRIKTVEYNDDIAKKHGMKNAIILHFIKTSFHKDDTFTENRYWRKSTSIIKELDFMSRSSVRRGIEYLRKNDLLLCRQFDASSFNQTCWYSLSDKALELYK